MTLVYGGDATNFFFGLLGNTLAVSMSYTHTSDALEQAILDAAQGRVAYDAFQKTLSGLPSSGVRDALVAVPLVNPGFIAAVNALFAKGQAATSAFFARYPELSPAFSAYVDSTDGPEERLDGEVLADEAV